MATRAARPHQDDGRSRLATGKSVGICGEAAASPALAPVLVGLGVTSLSMSASAVADVGGALAASTLADCREMAVEALAGRRPT